MSELSPNPERPTNGSVREASRGFIQGGTERLISAFDRNPSIIGWGSISTIAAVLFPLSRGDISSALVYGIISAVSWGGIAVWTDRHSRYLEEQSVRIKAGFTKTQQEKVLRDGG